MVVSYKEVQNLAGYTVLVSELQQVIDELDGGKYKRVMLDEELCLNRGTVEEANYVRFRNVPVVTPNGDRLRNDLSFEVQQGMHLMISGPNGSGKSSIFRILAELWPAFGGSVERPAGRKIMYIPQRVYLPPGTLRDQVIYPHTKNYMMRKMRVGDNNLRVLLRKVHLEYLIEREGGFDVENDWNDVLSGGEKQRISLARMLYHKPVFAVLDDSTSAVSVDVESSIY